MKKIQRVSKFFNWLFKITLITLPILYVIFWINAPAPVSSFAANLGFFISFIPNGINIMHSLSLTTKVLGFIITLLPLSINLFILYFLIHLFTRVEQDEIFSLRNVKDIKYIGRTMLIGQLLIQPIYQLFITATLTWHNPPGHRIAAISLSGTNLGLLLTAVLILLISWIIAEGYQLKEEQAYII